MKVLVLGANGATGFNAVNQLLKSGFEVKAVTRNVSIFTEMGNHPQLEVIQAGITEIDNQTLKDYLSDVDAVISCLGHNISIKGIFGNPRRLVTDSLIKIINSINPAKKVKIILMNTTACLNEAANEKFKTGEMIMMKILSTILPPQKDNELALNYLTNKIGVSNKNIEWVAVRPDTLIDENEVSSYTIHSGTTRSPLFNPGKTSRINVADFMAGLLKNENLWDEWKYKCPVIYNTQS